MIERPENEAVEAYLAKVPEPQRATLKKVRKAIRAAAPKEAEETIGYRLPAFYSRGPLVACLRRSFRRSWRHAPLQRPEEVVATAS